MSVKARKAIASLGGKAKHSKPRGFAAMPVKQRRAIAASGGRARSK